VHDLAAHALQKYLRFTLAPPRQTASAIGALDTHLARTRRRRRVEGGDGGDAGIGVGHRRAKGRVSRVGSEGGLSAPARLTSRAATTSEAIGRARLLGMNGPSEAAEPRRGRGAARVWRMSLPAKESQKRRSMVRSDRARNPRRTGRSAEQQRPGPRAGRAAWRRRSSRPLAARCTSCRSRASAMTSPPGASPRSDQTTSPRSPWRSTRCRPATGTGS
jgi:hypothetical protein